MRGIGEVLAEVQVQVLVLADVLAEVLVLEGVDFRRGMERVGFDGDALGWLQIID